VALIAATMLTPVVKPFTNAQSGHKFANLRSVE